MNRDNIVIVSLIMFPILVGGMATLTILVARRFSSAECPHCFRRIPNDAWKHGVPCPECGTELAETIPASQPNHLCRECSTVRDCVTLWDGETYCTACIANRNPRLLSLAAANQLAEDLPYAVGAVMWRMFLFALAAIGGFATLIAVPLAIDGSWQTAFQVFAGVLLISSPIILLWTCASAVALPLMRLKVIAWNRQLIVRLGTRLLIAPLTECTWHEGKVSQMTVWKYAFLLRGPALIVELPKEVAKDGNRLAVGYTDDTLDLWRSFFEMASIPQTAPRQSWWSRRRREKAE